MTPALGHHRRPLPLRNPYLFYLGHTPAFLNARLGRLGLGVVDARMAEICARGIDPDLQDTSRCELAGWGFRRLGWRGSACIACRQSTVCMHACVHASPPCDLHATPMQAHMHARRNPPFVPPCAGHPHSHEPAGGWPCLDQMLACRDAVREKLQKIYRSCGDMESGGSGDPGGSWGADQRAAAGVAAAASDAAAVASLPAGLQEVLWMAFEHEAM